MAVDCIDPYFCYGIESLKPASLAVGGCLARKENDMIFLDKIAKWEEFVFQGSEPLIVPLALPQIKHLIILCIPPSNLVVRFFI